ncbi:conjugative relaxase domain-containing protein, TrwC/TraI family [Nocardioides terrae]|uniref:Conjugative relaxase domain-containing protein, TrwC/TraI family n=1 Tax=Nocardioides terrae TaxID=574651 RepID=A0A1I1NIP0_9ACTN|nr:MobF family relaxase [Nocardioides terrae]SFC97286.1 conjugative relaxase domain-containing protein, TrwC/TraI family [Nocardioides terrae]
MVVHKLTAGDGYTYLTRQVASADERRARGQSLADYYTARGNPPGVWLGHGSVVLNIQGMTVSEAQMKALFGAGRHPDRERMLADGAEEQATKLGRAYPKTSETKDGDIRRPVAGYDLVFTPVKSASVLWALGGSEIRRAVEDVHHEAVDSTLMWIERHAAFTRVGHGGAAQIDTTGIIAAAFDHYASRSGDPDLHTHVALSNKVQGSDGKWRSLDGRVLHSLGVAASERYNTRFEDGLHRRLGVRFAERSGQAAGKRPVREIVGVPPRLTGHFSKRRAAIEDRHAELLRDYRSTHGREPSRVAQLQLAQYATLETREAKGTGKTLAEYVACWSAEATEVIGRRGLAMMLAEVTKQPTPSLTVSAEQIELTAREVVRVVSQERSTWTRWNVYAETERALRGYRFEASGLSRDDVTEAVVAVATSDQFSIRIDEPTLVAEPAALCRESDHQSVYRIHGGERYTSSEILTAEESLVAAAMAHSDAVDPLVAEAAIAVYESEDHVHLDSGQRQVVEYFATYPAALTVGIGPAGAGKTTAMRAYAAVLAADGRRLIPLASSAKAAQVLGSEVGSRAENLHKFLHEQDRDSADDWFRLGPRDVVLVDEAGMAGTLQLARLVAVAAQQGAVVRLLGDPSQLSAVEAGGALRLLDAEVGAVRLDHLHRFADPSEAEASTQLREGDPGALTFYLQDDRVRDGSRKAMRSAAYEAWAADMRAGLTSLVIVTSAQDVRALNTRARTERIVLGEVEADGVLLHDDTSAGQGDWIVTRLNLRSATCHHGREWVKNGDTWAIRKRHDDGSLTVRHVVHRGQVRLPAAYVAENVELAYASTAHRAQGVTVDTGHALVTDETTRESLYVASTRGRLRNTWYVATDDALETDTDRVPEPPRSRHELLTRVLARSGAEKAAVTTIREAHREAFSLPVLVVRYRHAWEHAAMEALACAVRTIPRHLGERILADPARKRLAFALARAAASGTEPGQLLSAAIAYDDLGAARSPAAVLTSRITDVPRELGVPDLPVTESPLPWLPAGTVGHAAWDRYLSARAHLIAARAGELGTLTAAYREQYGLTGLPPRDLGEPPPLDTAQYVAWRHARREQETTRASSRTPRQALSAPAPLPTRLPSRGTHPTR